MKSNPVALHLSESFGLGSERISMKPIGNGHINSTMLLTANEKSLVVQKLNTEVFPEPEMLVKNARLIETHLSQKHQLGEYDLDIIRHVPTQSQQFLVDCDNGVWRALEFIGGSYSEDVVKNTSQAEIAANAFGQFAVALGDFNAEQLYHVIPDFHNLAMRAQTLKAVIAKNPVDRLARCQAEVDFCLSQFGLINELKDLQGVVPVRPCHNDTKINNMLFCNKSHTAKAVIDLDTCMPGYWLYDFGDMVRTFCSPEEEDSTNLENVGVREEIFAALVKGYVEPLKDLITEQEKQSFWLGTKVMTFMIGLRFLTDYLDGDNYFAIKHAEHNLERAQNQFALYRDILAKKHTLKAILSDV
ncbi:aminoglycoside phosphotransferase family protein [Pseudoalteromonas shioyasakiensis]|uniref:phosphotransferase enzyme family protein n=1 Tax=Pseudoalteromonas shioyasakiensis TaxID=1190813 RepID=UPI0021193759|nr:aminoglycoside phosphotransferase family protein [Pseudoalteromonas shioyasakiensis]MCQ8879533.1 aminoglycoside phosphotransferase family protein [Pseudoalteromonas shioyasakiensis]